MKPGMARQLLLAHKHMMFHLSSVCSWLRIVVGAGGAPEWG